MTQVILCREMMSTEMLKLIQSLVDDAKPLNTKSYDDLIKLVKEYYNL